MALLIGEVKSLGVKDNVCDGMIKSLSFLLAFLGCFLQTSDSQITEFFAAPTTPKEVAQFRVRFGRLAGRQGPFAQNPRPPALTLSGSAWQPWGCSLPGDEKRPRVQELEENPGDPGSDLTLRTRAARVQFSDSSERKQTSAREDSEKRTVTPSACSANRPTEPQLASPADQNHE